MSTDEIIKSYLQQRAELVAQFCKHNTNQAWTGHDKAIQEVGAEINRIDCFINLQITRRHFE